VLQGVRLASFKEHADNIERTKKRDRGETLKSEAREERGWRPIQRQAQSLDVPIRHGKPVVGYVGKHGASPVSEVEAAKRRKKVELAAAKV
jgi:hypothetical protein